MRIRDAKISDVPELARLYRQFWGEDSDREKMAAGFAEIRDNPAYVFLCAEDDGGSLAGTVMGIVCRELYGDCRPFLLLENMIVDRERRQAGVGRALVGEMERRAKGFGCRQIILVTEKDRRDACAFYAALGFSTGNTGFKKKL